VAIPDYQTLMPPVLALHADGREHRSDEIRNAIVSQFSITDAERRQLLPSGRTPLLNNRVHWAVTYLAQAGALARTRRGYTQITDRGRDLLRNNPNRITKDDLEQFPEFVAFVSRSTGRSRRTSEQSEGETQVDSADGGRLDAVSETPEEIMDAANRELRSALGEELLDRVKAQPPEFFEELVLDVLTAMGYGGTRADAAERLGRSGDGGIDGVIREDILGLDLIYVQAKRWQGAVGRPVIQAFVGALHGAHADRGVLITTSHFTPDALAFASSVPSRVVLVDGTQLAELMIDHGVGVTEMTRYVLKRIDSDYFPSDVASPDGPEADEEHASSEASS
jgi:restriction system protein